LLKQLDSPDGGYFVGPAVIKVDGVNDLDEEIFGPVLHVATFKSGELDKAISDINGRGYGLTFGLQTRIERRIDKLTSAMKVGNIYVNRNQVGAVVGSQPFGGEGLSGTGPKAGGPHYLPRFYQGSRPVSPVIRDGELSLEAVQKALNNLPAVDTRPRSSEIMPGPTGESNELFTYARGTILCLGPTPEDAAKQAETAHQQGCVSLICVPGATGEQALDGFVPREALSALTGMDAVVCWSEIEDIRAIRKALAERDGPLIPIITEEKFGHQCLVERHVCIDTTAAGGNVSLLT
jgi:RHH-type proline utilization regulon transcriptional repressor/proline dehydrogenase/delta 1-pyrroline-5-carboxylate dehydrogenase